MTAFHEGAHAVVAVAVGVQVIHASIRPLPGEGIIPDSLGHICRWRHPDPRPEDCWSGSGWFETWAMVALAGYVMGELLDPDSYFLFEDWDNHRVVDLLREFTPREPEKGVGLLAQLRDRTRRLLIQPKGVGEVAKAADLLLEKGVVGGADFYQRLYGGRCSAMHPDQSEVRCQNDPHPYGSHWFRPGFVRTEPRLSEPLFWDGLPLPLRNQRVGSMTSSQKRIRAINLGQAPRPIPRAWRDALDVYTLGLAGL